MFKWFWAIFSLGAPDEPGKDSALELSWDDN